MICTQCNKSTDNPKFCSRSCAATYNNTRFPKRHLENICVRCEKPCTKERMHCKECWQIICVERSIQKWETETLGAMLSTGNANAASRYPYIRTLARKSYINSGRPMICALCGYDKHVDICHIKDVNTFPRIAFVSEVNAPNNLIALCKNQHWELDHDFL